MHEGHRKRLKAKLAAPDALRDSEILELLLFYACPRRDVSGAAKNLIGVFGDLAGVLSADVPALMAVDGVGKNMAEYLVCTGKVVRGIENDTREYFAITGNMTSFKKFMSERYLGEEGVQRDAVEVNVLGRDYRIARILPMDDYRILTRGILGIQKTFPVMGVALSIYRKNNESCAPREEDNAYVKEVIETCNLCRIDFLGWGIYGDDGFWGKQLSYRWD